MGRRHFKPEQIIDMLRAAEIKLAGGKTTPMQYAQKAKNSTFEVCA